MTTYRFLLTYGVEHFEFRTAAEASAWAARIGARGYFAL